MELMGEKFLGKCQEISQEKSWNDSLKPFQERGTCKIPGKFEKNTKKTPFQDSGNNTQQKSSGRSWKNFEKNPLKK